VSLGIAAGLVATNLECPARSWRPMARARTERASADDVTIRGALRVVDDAGRDLIFIGREAAAPGAAADSGQAVIGLFAGASSEAPQQTVRLATSAAGSALSLSTPDGARSVSIFAGESAVSVDLRNGDTSRTLSERAESLSAPPPQGVASEGPRIATTPTDTTRATGDAPRGAPSTQRPRRSRSGRLSVVGLILSDEGGLRLRGRLVNSTGIDQLRAEFRLLVGGRELAFSVARIAAGESTPFTLELPPARSDALRAARFRWVRSTPSYSEE
jgi:hypothetical protein